MPGHTDDEPALLRQAVAGDADALETLLLRHFDRVAAAISTRIPEDLRGAISAEDIVQEAFIVVFQRIRSFEPRGREAFIGWLMQIAENRLMDAAKGLRAAKRGGGWGRAGDAGEADDLVSALEVLPTLSRSPSRSAAAHEAVAALESALESLDPDYQLVLRLRYIEQQPVAACAERLQRSEGAVHMLLGRALAALRARMGDSARFFTRKN